MTNTKDKTLLPESKESYIEFITIALKFVVLYGLPAASKIIKSLTDDKIDASRIANLSVTKKPSEYFKCLADCVDDADGDGTLDSEDAYPNDPTR